MKQKLLEFWIKHKRLLLVVLLFVVLLSITLLVSQQTASKKLSPSVTPQAKVNPQTNVRKAPSVFFEKYNNIATTPTIPQSVTSYTLKNDFTASEVTSFGLKFGITTIETKGAQATGYNLTDIEKKGTFTLDKTTGAFQYQSFGSIKPADYAPGQVPQVSALSYLKELGLPTQLLSCPVTYQRAQFGEVTFVECHYTWEQLGLPYYNFAGLLNVPATTPLATLRLGVLPANAPLDESVTNVSTGDNGKARPNDFNTATVGIRKDGSIQSVDSNLRWIQSQQVFASARNLKSPEEALSQFLQHKAALSFTIPAGGGSFEYESIYPDNKAVAKEATITDYTLSYLERPTGTSQKYLTPMYTIKGVAVLTTGYRVRFVETLPALKTEQSFLSKIQPQTSVEKHASGFLQIPKAYAEDSNRPALQLKTFYPSLSPAVSQPAAVQPPATHSTPPPTSSTPDLKQFDPPAISGHIECGGPGNILTGNTYQLDVPGYGTVNLKLHDHTFFYESGAAPISALPQIQDALYKQLEEQYVINVSKRLTSDKASLVSSLKTVDDMKILFSTINGGSCPLLTADSRTAPVYNCLGGGVAGASGFDIPATETATTNVANRVLALIQQNQLATWAAKPDLFDASTLISLHATYVHVNSSIVYGGDAACYITGNSPAIFLYTPKSQHVSFTLPPTLTYADPVVGSDRTWNVIAHPNGQIENNDGVTFPYLYYEFSKPDVTFSPATEGFTTSYESWESTVRTTIAGQLKLTPDETNRLIIDIQNAVSKLQYSPYLTIAVVDPKEVNQKLPLKIVPQPDKLYRVMLTITPTIYSNLIPEPKLSPIERSGFTVVELGAKEEETNR